MDNYMRTSSGKSLPKRRRNIEQLTKSYVDLVTEAICSTQTKSMTVGEICAYFKAKYGSGKSEITLKNTVRHTLSCYSIFKKIRKEEYNRPALWTVDEDELDDAQSSSCVTADGPSDGPSTSGYQTDGIQSEGHSRFPFITHALCRVISMSCPVSLNEDPDEDFVEPSAARCSVPIALDKMP